MTNLSDDHSEAELRLPVIKESLVLQVEKRITGIVRIQKTVHETDTLVEQDLVSNVISVEHVPINRNIDLPVEIRQEGDVTIIPVMEEVVVVSKQLVLKEEIRITRQARHSLHRETVPLRSEQIQVERLPVTSGLTLAASPSAD